MADLPEAPILIAIILALFVGIGLHEYAHCKVADLSGDPTPRLLGRVTLNLTKHFEPTGVLMMVITTLSGYGIGWGKPAPCDMSKMRNPRWDGFATVAAGPISNLLQASVYALVFRLCLMLGANADDLGWFGLFLLIAVLVNVRLAFFNLIPLGLLDGHWLVGLLLPERQRFYWLKFNRSYGIVLIIGLILFSQYLENNGRTSPLTYLIDLPSAVVVTFLMGPVG